MQETAGAAGYGNHVVDLFPSESLAIRERLLQSRGADVMGLFAGSLSPLECPVQSLGL